MVFFVFIVAILKVVALAINFHTNEFFYAMTQQWGLLNAINHAQKNQFIS